MKGFDLMSELGSRDPEDDLTTWADDHYYVSSATASPASRIENHGESGVEVHRVRPTPWPPLRSDCAQICPPTGPVREMADWFRT